MATRTRSTWLGPVLGMLVGAAIATAVFAPHWSRMHSAGPMTVQARTVPAFTRVDLTGSEVVTITVGRPRSVQVRGNRDLVEQVTTAVDHGVLQIGTQETSRPTNGSVHVNVDVPALDALTLDGNGVIVANEVRTSRLTVRMPGNGIVRATGTVTRLDVSLDGSGDAQLSDVKARDVYATLGGSGRIAVRASHGLDASVGGTGLIVYGGDPPLVKTSVTGTGAIQRG
jgi:hypothetical protein